MRESARRTRASGQGRSEQVACLPVPMDPLSYPYSWGPSISKQVRWGRVSSVDAEPEES